MRKYVVSIVCVALGAAMAGAIIAALVQMSSQSREISILQSKDSQLSSQLSSVNGQLSTTDGNLAKLSLNMSKLANPSDPLAAYDEVCNTTVYSELSGSNETVYYPCTNQAQTIPQPGN
jgi:hypothetical protein